MDSYEHSNSKTCCTTCQLKDEFCEKTFRSNQWWGYQDTEDEPWLADSRIAWSYLIPKAGVDEN